MEIITSYPVRKIVVEFQEGKVYANGKVYTDIDQLVQWIKDCYKTHLIDFRHRQG